MWTRKNPGSGFVSRSPGFCSGVGVGLLHPTRPSDGVVSSRAISLVAAEPAGDEIRHSEQDHPSDHSSQEMPQGAHAGAAMESNSVSVTDSVPMTVAPEGRFPKAKLGSRSLRLRLATIEITSPRATRRPRGLVSQVK